MDYDVAGDIFPKTEPTSDFLMEDADNSTSRFAEPVTDKYIEELINNHENKNTKKNTGWAVGVFEKWRNFRNTGANIANPIPVLRIMTSEQLHFFLGRFVLEARKKDGTEYPPRSLYFHCVLFCWYLVILKIIRKLLYILTVLQHLSLEVVVQLSPASVWISGVIVHLTSKGIHTS